MELSWTPSCFPFCPFGSSSTVCSRRQAGTQQGCASRPSSIVVGKPYGISGEVLVADKSMCDFKSLNCQNAQSCTFNISPNLAEGRGKSMTSQEFRHLFSLLDRGYPDYFFPSLPCD